MATNNKTTSEGKATKKYFMNFEYPEASPEKRADFERADFGREIARLLMQKVYAHLTPELQEALKVAKNLFSIQDQVAPSDFYRVPKPDATKDCLEENITKAEFLLTNFSFSNGFGLPEGYADSEWKKNK